MNNKNVTQAVFLTLVLGLVLTGCVGIFNSKKNLKTGKSDITVINKPQPGQVAILDGNIIISKPLSNTSISSPVEISGRARVFEGTVLFRVRDAQNNIIATSSTQASIGAPEWGTYSKNLDYPQPPTPTGYVEVYTENAKDGSDQHLISMPVRFADFQNPVLKLFYSNITEDPDLLNCDAVYPVNRQIPFSNNILGGALGALFSGLTEEEVKQGFVNNLPTEGVELKSMSLATTTLTLDFNEALDEGVSGACRTAAIRAQITQTMTQFDGVDEVIISIDGEVDDVLQP